MFLAHFISPRKRFMVLVIDFVMVHNSKGNFRSHGSHRASLSILCEWFKSHFTWLWTFQIVSHIFVRYRKNMSADKTTSHNVFVMHPITVLYTDPRPNQYFRSVSVKIWDQYAISFVMLPFCFCNREYTSCLPLLSGSSFRCPVNFIIGEIGVIPMYDWILLI